MIKYYFKLDGDLIIDVIEYKHEGYIEVELPEIQLPIGINGGFYRWNGKEYVIDEALKKTIDDVQKEHRRKQNADIIAEAIDEYTIQLIEGGLLWVY